MRNLLLTNRPGKPSVLGLPRYKLRVKPPYIETVLHLQNYPPAKMEKRHNLRTRWVVYLKEQFNTSVRIREAFQKTCGTKPTLS